jgi:hypothetical protein
MDEREFLAQQFEEHRTRLRAVAYRMLGSLSEADDIAGFTIRNRRIVEMDVIADPEVLSQLDLTILD